MSGFYGHEIKDSNGKKQINIEFPCQPYMTVKQCADIFLALSTPSCIIALSQIKIESVIFFAHFFQCDYIFQHIFDIIYLDLTKLPHAIKTSLICVGRNNYMRNHDNFTDELLEFTCNHINERYTENVLELMLPARSKPHALLEYTEYVVGRLGKKIRDIERNKKYLLDRTHTMCMMCEKLMIVRNNNPDFHPMSCCGKLVHINCYDNFIQISKRFGERKCVYCNMKWYHGEVVCFSQYLKWCKYTQRIIEKKNILNMVYSHIEKVS